MMDHSIRFGKTVEDLYSIPSELSSDPVRDNYRHSYTDWFLIPKKRYSIEPPEVKSNIIKATKI